MPRDELKRARRRRDLARMKDKARRLYPHARRPEQNAENLAVCSCWMCGNPRRFFGQPTIQEKRIFAADAYETVS